MLAARIGIDSLGLLPRGHPRSAHSTSRRVDNKYDTCYRSAHGGGGGGAGGVYENRESLVPLV